MLDCKVHERIHFISVVSLDIVDDGLLVHRFDVCVG